MCILHYGHSIQLKAISVNVFIRIRHHNLSFRQISYFHIFACFVYKKKCFFQIFISFCVYTSKNRIDVIIMRR